MYRPKGFKITLFIIYCSRSLAVAAFLFQILVKKNVIYYDKTQHANFRDKLFFFKPQNNLVLELLDLQSFDLVSDYYYLFF